MPRRIPPPPPPVPTPPEITPDEFGNLPDIPQFGEGEAEYPIVTVYAAVHMQCKVGRKWVDRWRTVVHDTPISATRDEVLDAIDAIANEAGADYRCVVLGFDITAPLLYKYHTGG